VTGEPAPAPAATDVGRRIQRLRIARGLTQRDLATPRYTAAYVSSVESGRRRPSGDALAHFAERLGVTAAELVSGRSPAEAVRVDLRLVNADLLALSDPAAAGARYAQLADAAERLARPVTAARCQLGLARVALASRTPAAGWAEAAIAAVDRADVLLAEAAPHLRVEAVAVRAAVVCTAGDPRYATYLLATARDDLIRDGYPEPTALLSLHAELVVCHGELDEQDAAAASAVAALDLIGPAEPDRLGGMYATLADTLLVAGRLTDATAALDQARHFTRQAALGPQLAFCHRARARGRRAAGDLAGALTDLLVARSGFRRANSTAAEQDAAVELAELYRAMGQPEQATSLVASTEAEEATAARAARVRGQLCADAGDRAGAERQLRAALDGYRATAQRRELATTALLLASYLDDWGRTEDALALLHKGLLDVETLGEPTPAVVFSSS
jgi:transcriptional regulator with XRE-family HTH domain